MMLILYTKAPKFAGFVPKKSQKFQKLYVGINFQSNPDRETDSVGKIANYI